MKRHRREVLGGLKALQSCLRPSTVAHLSDFLPRSRPVLEAPDFKAVAQIFNVTFIAWKVLAGSVFHASRFSDENYVPPCYRSS